MDLNRLQNISLNAGSGCSNLECRMRYSIAPFVAKSGIAPEVSPMSLPMMCSNTIDKYSFYLLFQFCGELHLRIIMKKLSLEASIPLSERNTYQPIEHG